MARVLAVPDGRPGADGLGSRARRERVILAAVIAAEALLLAGGAAGFGFGAAVAVLGAVLFFLVAYRAPDLAWSLVFLAMPFSREFRLVRGLAVIVPTEPMMALALLALLFRLGAERSVRIPASPLHAPLAAIALIALVTAILGVAPLMGLKYWLVSAAYAAFGYIPFLVTGCAPSRRQRWQLLVVAVGGFWGLYGTVRMFLLGVSSRQWYGIGRPFFPEHGIYAAFLAILLPLALLLALERRGWKRFLYSLVALAIASGITLSFTRAAWLAVATVVPLACGAWARWRRRGRVLLLPVVLALAVAALITALGAGENLARHAESITSETNVSNLERLNRWSAALSMAESHPWLGVGFGSYEAAYASYRGRHFETEESRTWMGAHSEPLRLLSETGVPGFLAAIWFLGTAMVLGVRVFRKARDDADRTLALAAVSGIATYAVHGLFNAYLGVDKVSLPFWMALGTIAALGRSLEGPKPHHTRRGIPRGPDGVPAAGA